MKPLHTGSIAAVAFNRSPMNLTANITWAMLGLSDTTAVDLRDLWAHSDLGKVVGEYSVVVPSHGVFMFTATPL